MYIIINIKKYIFFLVKTYDNNYPFIVIAFDDDNNNNIEYGGSGMVILSAVVVMEPNRIAASKRVGKQINVCRNAASTTTKYTKWMDIYMYVRTYMRVSLFIFI